MKNYALFFDFDGTLAKHGKMSFITVLALRRAKKKGCLVFLNTGRSKGNTPKKALSSIDWDGIICGSSYVELNGKTIYNRCITRKELQGITECCERNDVSAIMEGVNGCYRFPSEGFSLDEIERKGDAITKLSLKAKLTDKLEAEFKEFCTPLGMGNYFEAIALKHDKSTGMKIITQALGIDRERVVAFGDNNNDLAAFRYAAYSVAMRYSPKALKDEASRVAKSRLYGVAEALRYLLK